MCEQVGAAWSLGQVHFSDSILLSTSRKVHGLQVDLYNNKV